MTCVTSRTCCGRLAIWGGSPIWRPLGLEARVARWLGGPSPPLLADLLPPRVGIDHGRVTCAVIPCPHAGQCQTRCPRPAAVPRLQPSTRTCLAAVHCVPVLMAGASRQPEDAIVRHVRGSGPFIPCPILSPSNEALLPRSASSEALADWYRDGRQPGGPDLHEAAPMTGDRLRPPAGRAVGTSQACELCHLHRDRWSCEFR